MTDYDLSIVITTYNRPKLLQRAVSSITTQNTDNFRVEIIIIDDHSQYQLPNFQNENLKIFIMPCNGGPGPARNKGLSIARADWVMMLDDDDSLEPDAIKNLKNTIEVAQLLDYPVIQFSRTNGHLIGQDRIISLDDYLSKRILGDFVPIFNRKLAIDKNIFYPLNRVGGEHLLWWKVARDYGIPTYSTVMVKLNDDAEMRMTHYSSQVKFANEHQKLAEVTLEEFGEVLSENYPEEFNRIQLGAITYSILSGDRGKAKKHIKNSSLNKPLRIILSLLIYTPKIITKFLFLTYRNLKG